MRNNTSLVFTLFCLLFYCSCQSVIIGEDPENTPENNFELFWNDFNESYSLFQARGWNWDSIYQVYRPEVNADTSFEELFDIFSEMVDYLDDSHTAIFERQRDLLFTSGYYENQAAHDIMDRVLVENYYLEEIEQRDSNNLFVRGVIKDKPVGFIYWQGIEDFHVNYFDEALVSFQDKEAIIIDLRSNRGGSGLASREIATRFSDGEHFIHTSKDKIGPGPGDFSQAEEIYTSIHGNNPWRKPIILLTNRATISAGEDFVLNMKSFADVTQIGDTTAGDFSNTSMHRFLPNGMEYKFSTQWYQLPDGSAIDGIGNIPDIEILNTQENVANNIDAVMEKAFEFLKDEYGIE